MNSVDQRNLRPSGPERIGVLALGIVLVVGCKAEPPPTPPDSSVFPDAAFIPDAEAPKQAAGPEYGVQKYLKVSVTGSLEATVTSSVGPEFGPALSQVITRTLVWWLNPSRDLLPKDKLEVVYELVPDEEPIVHAVWFTSKKLGKSFAVARHKSEKSAFYRYYNEDGSELEERLENSPIEDYEQVTSLLRDGRGHKGVDFKSPVGTPIVSPFAGKVVRKNWATRANGYSVDVATTDGMNAIFLHLDTVAKGIEVGSTISKGQEIGRSGNTGHSTAPHLHYQLERQKGRPLDPFEVHKTTRRHLPKEEQPSLTGTFERLARHRTS